MSNLKRKVLQKRAVTFTAAALFCSIMLFIGIFYAFINMQNKLSKSELSLPILEKTNEGQAVFSVLNYKKSINTEPLIESDDKRYDLLFLLDDESSCIFSLFEIIYENIIS